MDSTDTLKKLIDDIKAEIRAELPDMIAKSVAEIMQALPARAEPAAVVAERAPGAALQDLVAPADLMAEQPAEVALRTRIEAAGFGLAKRKPPAPVPGAVLPAVEAEPAAPGKWTRTRSDLCRRWYARGEKPFLIARSLTALPGEGLSTKDVLAYIAANGIRPGLVDRVDVGSEEMRLLAIGMDLPPLASLETLNRQRGDLGMPLLIKRRAAA